MFEHALSRLAHYFPRHASVQLRELYLTFGIFDLAVSAVSLFEPIYLYKLGYSIPHILFFYLAIYLLYFAILPLGATFSLRYGYAKGIFSSSFFSISYYLALIGLPYSPFLFFVAIFFA